MNLDFEIEERNDDVLNRLLAQLNLSDSEEDVEMVQARPIRERKRIHNPSPVGWQKKLRFGTPVAELKPVILRRKAIIPRASMSGEGLCSSKPEVEADVPWVDSAMVKALRKKHFEDIARQEQERLNPDAQKKKFKEAEKNLTKLMNGGKICKKCHLYK
jgi:hypothetical protein